MPSADAEAKTEDHGVRGDITGITWVSGPKGTGNWEEGGISVSPSPMRAGYSSYRWKYYQRIVSRSPRYQVQSFINYRPKNGKGAQFPLNNWSSMWVWRLMTLSWQMHDKKLTKLQRKSLWCVDLLLFWPFPFKLWRSFTIITFSRHFWINLRSHWARTQTSFPGCQYVSKSFNKSYAQRSNLSFHVVERTKTAVKCT